MDAENEMQREEVSVAEISAEVPVARAGSVGGAGSAEEEDEEFDLGELTAGSGEFPKETVERVASLSAHGVPDEVVRKTLFLSKEDLLRLKHTEIFVFTKAQKLEDLQSNKLAISEGWDNVEALGLNRVRQVLETGLADPRFALMAAKMANTARRPLDPGNHSNIDAGGTIVLHLAKSIREKIREGNMPLANPGTNNTKALKDTRVLPAANVDALLTKPGANGTADEKVATPESSFMALLSAAFSTAKL